MPAREKIESAALATLLVVCAAFVVSFALGIGGLGRTTAAAVPETAGYTVPERSLGRVEVLNASGRGGMARAATQQLRDGGFDVVFFGNASGFDGDSSVVIDRIGDDVVARAAARRLGITRVHTQRDTTLFLDATVIVGRDWTRGEPEHSTDEAQSWGARVARWLKPTR
jgi:hypothetical protein